TEYSFSSAVTAKITLYAHWSADTYTVTFNSNGGSSVSSQTVSYGSSAAKPTNPTRDGYTFLGWYTSSTGGTEYSFSSSVTSSFTLYAHWAEQTAATYTVSFDMNYPSGFSGASNVPSSQTVEEGAAATEPTAPTLEGCTFLGWYLRDGTKYSFSTAVTENITLYASWDVSTFTVSYNLNYENAVGVWTTETVNYGSTASEPATPARDGYTFLGWYTINGAKYDFTSSVTSNITLYAQWEEIIETYTVTFRWNYENDPGVYLTTTVEEGSTVSEPTDPTRSGHTFLGWYTASGTLYDFSTPVTGNLVLYAQWS
ncbi:MAG: InlB B-repeat-containing protein, partial [Firmicutes bacterium]|nr:InlB B-repeat-containing protein [Bacillota bacterium]